MKINEMKIVYFSPTGTTRKVVMEIAKNIGLKSVSFDLSAYKEKYQNLSFKKDDFALLAAPVYSGRVPGTFLERLDKIKGDGTPAAIVVTYGCRAYDDALLELKNEAEARGFKVIAAAAFPVEHSLIRTIGTGRPNRDDMKIIADYGIRINRRLKQENSFDAFDIKVPGNMPYVKFHNIPLFPKLNKTYCTLCKECVKACPTGAIDPAKPQKIARDKCIRCFKCVRVCKQMARTVGDFKMSFAIKSLTPKCDPGKQAEIFM